MQDLSTILFLVDALERPGGTETHLLDLSLRLPGFGYRAIVCNLAGEQPLVGPWRDEGVEVWTKSIHRLYLPAGRASVREVIAEAKPRRIAAVHTFHFKSDWMGTTVARALGCPLISSRRDLGFAQTPLRKTAYRSINPQVTAFIAPSNAVKRAVMEREGIEDKRVHVIYNGLDIARFDQPVDVPAAREWLGVPVDAVLVGMVGNLKPIKDHPTLIRAMQKVIAEQPKAHLVLIGEGADEAKLRALAAELGIAGKVTFAGSRQEIPRVLAALDIFVLSSHSEGMSNAVIEAMAAGKPVIATDVGGNAECVVSGETGYITPPAGVDAMADRLLELAYNPTVAASMGAAGRLRATDVFDVNSMVGRTADLYALLAGARKEAAHAH